MFMVQPNQHSPVESWKVAVPLCPCKAGHHRNLPALVEFLDKTRLLSILGSSSCGKQLHFRQTAVRTARLAFLDDHRSLTIQQQPVVSVFSILEFPLFLKYGP